MRGQRVIEGKTSDDEARRARTVAERMIGMPLDLDERLDRLEERIAEDGLLPADDVVDLCDRLQVTMQGLDVRPQRPSAVLLLMGPATAVAEAAAGAIAEELFGGPDRIVELDLGHFNDAEDLNTLVGPPPGYIGFEERRPLHALTQMPWSVLLCKNVDGCHPEVANVVVGALADGVLTERSGRRIYLSDAVVVLTASAFAGTGQPIGFHPPGNAEEADVRDAQARGVAARRLGPDLVSQVDVVALTVPEAGTGARGWVERRLLAGLAGRYRQRGLELTWDPPLVDWILGRRAELRSRTDLVREVEDSLGSALVPLLPGPGHAPRRASLTVRDGHVEASAPPATGGGELA